MSLFDLIKPYIGATIGMLVVALVSFAASKALGEARPVNSYVMVTGAWEFSGNTARNEFSGLKVRDCKEQEASIRGLAMIGGEVYSGIDIKYTGKLIKIDGKGSVYLGPITWSNPSMSRANKLGFTMSYECKDQIIWGEYWYDLPLLIDR